MENGGYLPFCVKTALYEAEYMVNFDEVVFNLTIDLTAGIGNFKLSVDLERKEADEHTDTLDYSSYVYAYLCTDDRKEITNPPPFSQGSVMSICVTSTDTSYVLIDEIQSLTVKQDEAQFDAITNGKPTVTSLVASDGKDCILDVCNAKVMLLAKFFEVDAPNDIAIIGSVKMRFPSSPTRRFLKASLGSGSVPDVNEGSFGINVKLEKPRDVVSSASKNSVMIYSVIGAIIFSVIF